jgi:ribosomal protein L37AE/L43A
LAIAPQARDVTIFLPSVSAAAIVLLRCPHCHERQVRARGAEDDVYVCQKCGLRFRRAQCKVEDGA